MHTDKFLLAGRLFVSFLGSLTVGLVYYVGTKVFSKKTGFISAVFLLFSFGHFVKSTEVRPDIFFSLFFVLAVYIFYLIYKNPEKKTYYLYGGIILGSAVSTKPNGLSLLVPFVTLFLFLVLQNKMKMPKIWKPVILFVISAVVTFSIFNFPRILSGAIWEPAGLFTTSIFGSLCYQTPYKHSLMFYINPILPRMVSLPLTLVFFISTIVILFLAFRRKNSWIPASLVIITIYSYLLPMGWYTRASWRDLLPIIPLIYLAISYLLVAFFQKKASLILSAVVILLLIVPIKNIFSHIEFLHNPDTRELSKSWVESNIPGGARIANQIYGTPLRRNRDSLSRQWTSTDDILIFSLKNYDEKAISYDVFLFSDFIDPKSSEIDYNFEENLVNYIQENKIDYLVISSRSYSRWFAPAAEVHVDKEIVESVRGYYQTIENKLKLIKEFIPDKKTTPGPVIKIYKVPEDIKNYQSKRIFDPVLRDGDGTLGYFWH